MFLDITASSDGRDTMVDVVRRTAEQVFIPFTVGGGIRTVDDARRMLRAGADKVSVNTAAVERPELIAEIATEFGAQCVVCAIDAKRRAADRTGFEVYLHGGRTPTGIDAVAWAVEAADARRRRDPAHVDGPRRHAGRLRPRADRGPSPTPSACRSSPAAASARSSTSSTGIVDGGADAVLAASIFHFGEHTSPRPRR